MIEKLRHAHGKDFSEQFAIVRPGFCKVELMFLAEIENHPDQRKDGISDNRRQRGALNAQLHAHNKNIIADNIDYAIDNCAHDAHARLAGSGIEKVKDRAKHGDRLPDPQQRAVSDAILHQQLGRAQQPQQWLLKQRLSPPINTPLRMAIRMMLVKLRCASSCLPSPILRAQTVLPPEAKIMDRPPISIPSGKMMLMAESALVPT